MTEDVTPIRRRPAGLGRGLSALLGDVEREHPIGRTAGEGDVRSIAVADIRPHPNQPRRHFDEEALDELAASITARGVLQPIVVRPANNGYEIVAGERRWRAAQRARLHELPALVREIDDAGAFEIAIIENIQRANLNAIEEAEAYRRLMVDYGHSQEEIGRFVSKSRSHVANLLRLLDLPQAVRGSVASGAISMGHARAIVTAEHPEQLAGEVVRRGLSVRETERMAREAKGEPAATRPRAKSASATADADILALERQLGDMLGLAVEIAHAGPGGGLTVRYSTLEQLDMICQRLSGERF